MTVLIVEDNAGVRRLLRQALAEVGDSIRIYECEDGADAAINYGRYRPDLVLMDIRMPHTDGLTATRQIRQSDPAAKIVIVTNYDDEGLRSAAREAGACGYARKHNLTELPALIKAIVAR